jgi:hypothetical protein
MEIHAFIIRKIVLYDEKVTFSQAKKNTVLQCSILNPILAEQVLQVAINKK